VSDPTARERILGAAEALFAERGFRGATIEAIAAAAGVNRALLYYYFESKEDVYERLAEKGVNAFRAILDALPGPGTPVGERLAPLIRAYLNLCASDEPLARIVRRETAAGDVRQELMAAPLREIGERIAQLLQEAMEAGQLRPLDPLLAACSLLGMMNVFHDVTLLGAAPIDVDASTEHTLALFLCGAEVRGRAHSSTA